MASVVAPATGLLQRVGLTVGEAWIAGHAIAATHRLAASGVPGISWDAPRRAPQERVGYTQVAGPTEQNPHYPGATVLPVSYAKPDLTLTDMSEPATGPLTGQAWSPLRAPPSPAR